MYKRYFIKKNPHCRKKEIEWVELGGREFYQFINDPENKDRHFVDMDDVVLECAPEQARGHRSEVNHRNYLKEQEEEWSIVSLYAFEDDDGMCGEDIIADLTQTVEETAISNLQKRTLREALQMLSTEDYMIIEYRYLSHSSMSEADIGAIFGLTQSGLSRRLKKIRTFLKKAVIELEKNQQ